MDYRDCWKIDFVELLKNTKSKPKINADMQIAECAFS